MGDAVQTAVTEVKRHATEILARLRKTRVPVVVTEHGRSSAVMLDMKTYEGLLARLEVLSGIARGERALFEGRVLSHSKAKKRLSRWLANAG